MAPGSRSKVSKANPRTTSLACVIPRGIVEQLDLSAGDYLDWDVRSNNGDKHVLVRKVRGT